MRVKSALYVPLRVFPRDFVIRPTCSHVLSSADMCAEVLRLLEGREPRGVTHLARIGEAKHVLTPVEDGLTLDRSADSSKAHRLCRIRGLLVRTVDKPVPPSVG
jgi:hypothetical protein